jgi:hypothetical protein
LYRSFFHHQNTREHTQHTNKQTHTHTHHAPIKDIWGDDEADTAVDSIIKDLTTAQIRNRIDILKSNVRVAQNEVRRVAHESKSITER